MNVQENLVQIFRACIPENFGAAYPPFWLFVPPVKNHCSNLLSQTEVSSLNQYQYQLSQFATKLRCTFDHLPGLTLEKLRKMELSKSYTELLLINMLASYQAITRKQFMRDSGATKSLVS